MPVCTSDTLPRWCELERYQVAELAEGQKQVFQSASPRQHFICTSGKVKLSSHPSQVILETGGQIEVIGPGEVTVEALERAQLFRAEGRWRRITSSGIFTNRNGDSPKHDTPYPYQKTTTFDNHYHDCDEWWIILDGQATVASEGKLYDIAPGQCLATGMGWHHDVVRCKAENGIRAIWFEGTLEGACRFGHLWEPRHGKAEPKLDRV
jgi:mannose-6-phosphate isomerase-like protein (cupin superfamily)